MKIYLDMCSIQRPFDTKTQLRIAIEAEAIVGIIALCESGQIDLIASDALLFETERNPYPIRKRHALEVLAKAALFVQTDRRVEAQADYFCTCDDRFLRRARRADTLQIKVVSPLELIEGVTS